MGGGRIFLKTFRASLFIDDLSNEPNFGRNHLAGQYVPLMGEKRALRELDMGWET